MDSTIIHNYELLLKHYGNKYTNFDLFFQTYEGLFVFSRIDIVSKVLQALLEKEMLAKNSIFLETGSGDGRIVALASILGFLAQGIELSQDMADISINHINQLKEEKILTGYAKIVQGDFLNNETYTKLDYSFNDIDVFFNYYTNTEPLIKKIVKEARVNCILVSISLSKRFVPSSLELIYSSSLPDHNHYLFVYKKKN